MTHVLVRGLTLSVLASVLLALALAGCGGGGDEEDASSGPQTATGLDAADSVSQRSTSR